MNSETVNYDGPIEAYYRVANGGEVVKPASRIDAIHGGAVVSIDGMNVAVDRLGCPMGYGALTLAWRVRNVAAPVVPQDVPADPPADPHRPLSDQPDVTLWNTAGFENHDNVSACIKVGGVLIGTFYESGGADSAMHWWCSETLAPRRVWNPNHKVEDLRKFVAEWRAKQSPVDPPASFVPTPHEPVEGVTLWNAIPQSATITDRDAGIKVDGVECGYITGNGSILPSACGFEFTVQRAVQNPLHSPAKLAAFAAQVRQERQGTAAPAQAEKPLWVEGQRFRQRASTDDVWWVQGTAVMAHGGNGTPWHALAYPTIEKFSAAIASGELIPAQADPTPADSLSPPPPPAGEPVAEGETHDLPDRLVDAVWKMPALDRIKLIRLLTMIEPDMDTAERAACAIGLDDVFASRPAIREAVQS